jgi:hypothetical protein
MEKSELNRNVGFMNVEFMIVQRQVTYPMQTRGVHVETVACATARHLAMIHKRWQNRGFSPQALTHLVAFCHK